MIAMIPSPDDRKHPVAMVARHAALVRICQVHSLMRGARGSGSILELAIAFLLTGLKLLKG